MKNTCESLVKSHSCVFPCASIIASNVNPVLVKCNGFQVVLVQESVGDISCCYWMHVNRLFMSHKIISALARFDVFVSMLRSLAPKVAKYCLGPMRRYHM